MQKADQNLHMAAGQSSVIEEAVSLHIKFRSFSWTYVFFILEDSPVPCILGADFLASAKMRFDFASLSYSFAFQPLCQYDFDSFGFSEQHYHVFPSSERFLYDLVAYVSPLSFGGSRKLNQLVLSVPRLFSNQLGTVKGMVYRLHLTDEVPVRSRPYQCSTPRLQALREIVQDLMEKGVIRKSFSLYPSPAFLVAKLQGGYRMVVDYRLLKKCGVRRLPRA
jgi:hypothetical protein